MLKDYRDYSNFTIIRNADLASKLTPSRALAKNFLISSLSTLAFFLAIGDYTHVDYLISVINYVVINHPHCIPKDNLFGVYSMKELFQDPNLMAEIVKNRSHLPIIQEVIQNPNLIVEVSRAHNDFSVISEAVRDPNLIGELNRVYDNIAPHNNLPIEKGVIRAPESDEDSLLELGVVHFIIGIITVSFGFILHAVLKAPR